MLQYRTMQRREFLLGSASFFGLQSAPAFDREFGSALTAAEAIRMKKVSAVELTRHCFGRIERYNSKLNAIVVKLEEQAMKRAKEADAALARNQSWGPFHGVPITIKESFAIEGTPTTWGLPQFKDTRSKTTAVAVERLEKAGAILAGKTNVPVMLSDWQSYNPIHGTCNNPWDLSRTPGGSTGGGSAAVAAGLGYLTLGSDIGGSIRVPAHFCGVYGHKTTLDLIPLIGHSPGPDSGRSSFFADLPVAGPLARSAEDLREAVRVMGGPAVEYAAAYRWELPPPRQKRLRDFRVGYIIDDRYCPLTPDLLPVLNGAIDALRKAGVKLEKGWPAGVDPDKDLNTYLYLLSATLNARLPASDRERMRAAYQKDPKDPWNAAVFESHDRWLAQTGRRHAARAAWQDWFRTHDVFLMPVAFSPAYPHDHSQPFETRMLPTATGKRPYMDMIRWVAPATLTGLPATVAPVGRTAAGLPVGIQIVGPFLEDGTSIEFAARLKDVAGGFVPPKGYA